MQASGWADAVVEPPAGAADQDMEEDFGPGPTWDEFEVALKEPPNFQNVWSELGIIYCDLPVEHSVLMRGVDDAVMTKIAKTTGAHLQFNQGPNDNHMRLKVSGSVLNVYWAHTLMMARYHEVEAALQEEGGEGGEGGEAMEQEAQPEDAAQAEDPTQAEAWAQLEAEQAAVWGAEEAQAPEPEPQMEEEAPPADEEEAILAMEPTYDQAEQPVEQADEGYEEGSEGLAAASGEEGLGLDESGGLEADGQENPEDEGKDQEVQDWLGDFAASGSASAASGKGSEEKAPPGSGLPGAMPWPGKAPQVNRLKAQIEELQAKLQKVAKKEASAPQTSTMGVKGKGKSLRPPGGKFGGKAAPKGLFGKR